MANVLYAIRTDFLRDTRAFEAWYRQMPEDRQQKISRFRFEKDKRLSLGAGILLQTGLAAFGASDRAIGYGCNGKPFLRGRSDLFFNLSHAGSVAVCAFSDRPVGVDVEEQRQFEEALIRRVFGEAEILQCEGSPAGANAFFTSLWTIKESLMKQLGTGMALAPDAIRIHLNAPVTAAADGFRCESLRFTPYALTGYALTVCSEYFPFSAEIQWVF